MKNKTIKIAVAIAALTVPGIASAQTIGKEARPDSTVITEVPEGYELADSVIFVPAPVADSAFVGKDIFRELPLAGKGDAANVRIHQSQEITDAMYAHFDSNKSRTLTGYRVRIFFDNKRTSRTDSENALNAFTEKYKDIAAYRSYNNPYFKVTVGDFRTKSEAMQLLRRIRYEFPAAFIVKEYISYPVVDRKHPIVADTIKVLRPLPTE